MKENGFRRTRESRTDGDEHSALGGGNALRQGLERLLMCIREGTVEGAIGQGVCYR